jgi:hypothetical protein
MTLTDQRAGSNLGVLRTQVPLQADVGPHVRGKKTFVSGGQDSPLQR